jgi:hypothetical protein
MEATDIQVHAPLHLFQWLEQTTHLAKCVVQKEGKMADQQVPIVMEDMLDPAALAQARVQDERYKRNFAWFQAHAAEIFTRHRGKCICIAGEELFVADTPEAVIAQAMAAHPEDDGSFMHYIPRQKAARIYAH